MIRVVIADDQEIFREGLEMALEKAPGICFAGEAENGRELIALVEKEKPDVVLTDIVMPVMDGIKATEVIAERYPGMGVVALSMYGEEALINDMFEAGALGYLIKNADKSEIYEAIESAYKGRPYYCRTTSLTMSRFISRKRSRVDEDEVRFNEKEIEIIKGICDELSNEEMAKTLFMSKRTIDGYRSRILAKLNVKSAIGVVKYAIKQGIYRV